jgi:hypothetical protein
MNTDQRRRGGFEERLLNELRSLVVAPPSSGAEQPPQRPRAWLASRSRRRLALVGSMAALLVLAAAAGVPFLSSGAAPAYAVNTNDDGTVTVEINSLSDAAGLESKLREAGIRAVVQYLPPGKACKQPWFTLAEPASSSPSPGGGPAIKGGVEHTIGGHTRFTISKNLPADETLVIMTQVGADASGPSGVGSPTSIGVAFAKGEVKPCEIVDAPASSQPVGAPPPGGGVLHTNGGTLGAGTSASEAGSATSNGSGSANSK